MEPDLLGYLLGLLEPEEEQQVVNYLQAHPQAWAHLQAWRQLLAQLAADAGDDNPPADLAERTLAQLPAAGPPLPGRAGPRQLPRAAGLVCHWADALVVSLIVLVALGMGLSGVARLRQSHEMLACQNNLRQFYAALKGYSERHHDQFPDIAHAAPPPRNIAGLVLPVLVSAGDWPSEVSLRCPGNRTPPATPCTLQQVLHMSDAEFEQQAGRLSPGYAYSLGYRDDAGQYHSPQFDPQLPLACYPLMSDRPPADLALNNSLNHGGQGQNVLFLDGHVRFCTHRQVGVAGDDIFVNRANVVAAGLDSLDAVLGSSDAQP